MYSVSLWMIPNWGTVDTLGGRTATLRDLNIPEKQAGRNIMEFSNGKCEVPHLDWNNLMQQHWLWSSGLEGSLAGTDVGSGEQLIEHVSSSLPLQQGKMTSSWAVLSMTAG